MKIRMKLMSDTIFGNGMSVPGGEDISVLHDVQGFPYFRGSTFKGIFREMLIQYLEWTDIEGAENRNNKKMVQELLGESGDTEVDPNKLVFSDFCVPENVRARVLEEIGDDPAQVLDAFTHIRTFTAMGDNGTVKKGSMRTARCVNKGLVLEAEIQCVDDRKELVEEVLSMIKWVGTMRTRGFGKVQIEIKEA